jgi:DNA-binding transcriptional ArsR family regulator
VGELVAGKPVLQLNFRVSLPLDMVSVMSLLYRAVPGSGLDPWLVATRRSMPEELRIDLDLLHGFSGRLLYYMEEPVMRFLPLEPDRADAQIDDLLDALESEPAEAYLAMMAHALERVHRDLGESRAAPDFGDELGWRQFVEPALTTATGDDVWRLIQEPEQLKRRTVSLIRGVWADVYGKEFQNRLPMLTAAARLAEPLESRGFGQAFADLTGSRLPSPLLAGLNEIEAVTFCPSAHLGSFVSYIRYPPNLIVFFGAPDWIGRSGAANRIEHAEAPSRANGVSIAVALSDDDLLDGLRALADPNRLRIIELLGQDELYAQEIVGRLGIAQSAVSRHLALLERAGLVLVQPRRGMKYYRICGDRLTAVADAVRARMPA